MSDEYYDKENVEKLKDDEQFETAKSNWDSRFGTMVVGLIFLMIGGGLLLANFTSFSFHNWWALFILIPAFSSLGYAYQMYHENGRLGEKGSGALIGGMIMLAVALIFLLGLNWGVVWPVFLIIIGAGILLKARANG